MPAYLYSFINVVSLLSVFYCLKLKTDKIDTDVLQWLEQLWDYENVFGTGVVRANEC